jgi:hypothetical protein
MSMKYSTDTIGNRNRDFSSCSAVPQPTAPSRAPNRTLNWFHNFLNISWIAYTNYDDIRRGYLRSSGTLRSVWWWFSIDVLGRPIGSHVQGLRIPSCPSSTSWLLRMYRWVVPKRRYENTTARCVISQKKAELIYFAAKAWDLTY